MLLLVTAEIAFFLPQINASPSLQPKTAEVYSFGTSNLVAIDVTSNGTVFANVNSDVYRSCDYGLTWTKVLDAIDGFVYFLRVDSQNRVFSATYNDTGGGWHNDIYRSDDYGLTWVRVLSEIPKVWRLTELSNGTLLMNTYSTTGADLIYKSDDGGLTWSIWQDLTSLNNDHIHCVRVNPYNDDIWALMGDKSLTSVPTVMRWDFGASSWTYIYNTTSDRMYTDVIFDSAYAYLLPDRAAYGIQRLPHRGSWNNQVEVFNLHTDDTTTPTGIPYSMIGAVYDDGLMIVPTDRETVYASIDGVRWLKIFQTTYSGSGAWRLDYISQRRDANGYWYFINDYTNKVYRSRVDLNDVRVGFGLEYNEYLGTIDESQMRIPVENDTHIFFNITNSDFAEFKVSIMGLTRGNFLANPSFETGDLGGWTVGGASSGYGVTTRDKYDGDYSLMINKTIYDTAHFWVESSCQNLYEYGECWYSFAYVKANTTGTTFRIELGCYVNSTWTTLLTRNVETPTGWMRIATSPALQSSTPKKIWTRFYAYTHLSKNFTMYFDSMLLERKVRNHVVRKVNDGNTIVYKAGKTMPTASMNQYGFTETQNVNITFSVCQEQINYIGNLTEGARQDFMFTLSAAIFDIYVEVGGSKQVMLIVTFSPFQTRELTNYNHELKIAGNPFVVSGTETIMSLSWQDHTLTFAVNATPGTNSITKVHVDDEGKPANVIGTTSWSYDATKKILYLATIHSSPLVVVTVKWNLLGDIDENGSVNATDLYLLGKAYGSTGGPPQDPNWNPNADLNQDNNINEQDLHALDKNYGKTQ